MLQTGLSREAEGSHVLSLCFPSRKSYSVGEEIAAQLHSSGLSLREPFACKGVATI